MFQIKDNSNRAKQIISVFWVVIVLSILNICSLLWQNILLKDAKANPEGVDMSKIETSDMVQMGIGIFSIGIYILTVILFIMWFRRAYYNLHLLKNNCASLSEGWAAGGWFIPIMNWVRPCQIMKEIWQGTQTALSHKLGEPKSNSIIGIWWTLYLIMSIYSNIVARFSIKAESIDELLSASKMELIGELLTIPAAIVTVILIQRTQVFEAVLLEESQQPAESIFSSENFS